MIMVPENDQAAAEGALPLKSYGRQESSPGSGNQGPGPSVVAVHPQMPSVTTVTLVGWMLAVTIWIAFTSWRVGQIETLMLRLACTIAPQECVQLEPARSVT